MSLFLTKSKQQQPNKNQQKNAPKKLKQHKKNLNDSYDDMHNKHIPVDKSIFQKKPQNKTSQYHNSQQSNNKSAQQLQPQANADSKFNSSLMELTNKYKLLGKIGQGGFGFIYKAKKISSGITQAIKFERKQQSCLSRLEIEAHLLKILTEQRKYGFPKFISYVQTSEFSYIIMESLGLNLEQLLMQQSNKQFSLKTVCMVGLEMLDRIKVVHGQYYVYRDIKPENIMIGELNDYSTLYLIDFGLAKRFKNSDGNHVEEIQRKGLVGTPRYASINSHNGKELSRRDDLESLCYMLIYLAKGTLPWMNTLLVDKEAKRQQIKLLKETTTTDQLCEGLPLEFSKFLQYSKDLPFKGRPSYRYLQKLLNQVLISIKEHCDYHFDWQSRYRDGKNILNMFIKEKKLTNELGLTSTQQKQTSNSFYPASFKQSLLQTDQTNSSARFQLRMNSVKQVKTDLQQDFQMSSALLKVDDANNYNNSSKLPQCSTSDWDISLGNEEYKGITGIIFPQAKFFSDRLINQRNKKENMEDKIATDILSESKRIQCSQQIQNKCLEYNFGKK